MISKKERTREVFEAILEKINQKDEMNFRVEQVLQQAQSVNGLICLLWIYFVKGIPEMIEIATSKVREENKKSKHSRHASSGKMYLYDILEIKKETSKSCQE